MCVCSRGGGNYWLLFTCMCWKMFVSKIICRKHSTWNIFLFSLTGRRPAGTRVRPNRSWQISSLERWPWPVLQCHQRPSGELQQWRGRWERDWCRVRAVPWGRPVGVGHGHAVLQHHQREVRMMLRWMTVHYKSVLKSRQAGYCLSTFPWFCMPPPPPFRHSDNRMLKIQQHRCKTHGFHTFSCFGPHIWNSHPTRPSLLNPVIL